MTGDDHATGGTAAYFNRFRATSPAGCSVADWECVRATSYMYAGTPITDAQAAAFEADGLRARAPRAAPAAGTSPQAIARGSARRSARRLRGGVPEPGRAAPPTALTASSWSDWATEPKLERAHGIRLDTTYYYLGPPGMATAPGTAHRIRVPAALRGPRRLPDRRLPGDDAGHRRVRAAGCTSRPTRCSTTPSGAGLVRRVHGEHAHRQRRPGEGERHRRRGSAARRAGGVRGADARLAGRARRLVVHRRGLRRRPADVLAGARPAGARPRGDGAGAGPGRAAARPHGGGQPVAVEPRTVKGVDYAVFKAAAGDYVATYAAERGPPRRSPASPRAPTARATPR